MSRLANGARSGVGPRWTRPPRARNPDRSIAATFQALPGASFVVNGAAQARDAALTTASAEVKFSNGLALAATFEGEFSDVTASYAGKGMVRYAW